MIIFISYSSKEHYEARKIRERLEAKGYTCWMAPESMHASANYMVEIPKAIECADVFLLVLTEKSQASEWVLKELDRAIHYGKRVIPLHLDESEINEAIGFATGNVQRIEAHNRLFDACEQLISQIKLVEEEKKFAVDKMDNGSIIEHYIRDGVWDGPFTEKTVNGGVYKGTYVNSHIEGVLTYVDRNNNEFVCEYRNNNWNGDGVYKSSKGVLTGHWTDGKLDNNYGVYKYNNGSIYEGEVRKFMRDGKGVMHFPENDIRLKAEFKEDIIIGKVTITFPNGDFYCGEWKDLIEGNGVFYSKNCDIPELTFVQYDGLWRNSLMSGGRSELVFVSSNKKKYKYIGNFISGTANGYGYLYECDFKGKEKKLIYDVWKNNRIENESKSNSRIREAEDLLAVSTDYINRIISTIPKKSDIAVL